MKQIGKPRWLVVSIAAMALLFAGCPTSVDNGNGKENGNGNGQDGWETLWAFATDEHFQGLDVDVIDVDAIFEEDGPLGARTLLAQDGEFEIRTVASPVERQAISLHITADVAFGGDWGAGVVLFGDVIVDGGFQVGDRISVIGQAIEVGDYETEWSPANAPVPGGKITFATPGYYKEPWDNPLNVDPLVLASISTAGPINFSVVLTSAHIANLKLAVTAPREDGNRSLAVGIEALDRNVIRIDNILFERPTIVPEPKDPVTIDLSQFEAQVTGADGESYELGKDTFSFLGTTAGTNWAGAPNPTLTGQITLGGFDASAYSAISFEFKSSHEWAFIINGGGAWLYGGWWPMLPAETDWTARTFEFSNFPGLAWGEGGSSLDVSDIQAILFQISAGATTAGSFEFRNFRLIP